MDDDSITAEIVDAALAVHRRVGPGLLEVVYEAILARLLTARGLVVERQRAFAFAFEGLEFPNAFRVDLLVGGRIVVELKSANRMLPIHTKQLLTYLRLLELPVGLLLNFGGETMKAGVRRVVNNYRPPSSLALGDSAAPRPSRLRVVGSPSPESNPVGGELERA
ncbi:MAG: GxxExxY protein [Gemmatimonadales bacterium]|nr:GxxExxY protein [Gemmatimonadales bacterium]